MKKCDTTNKKMKQLWDLMGNTSLIYDVEEFAKYNELILVRIQRDKDELLSGNPEFYTNENIEKLISEYKLASSNNVVSCFKESIATYENYKQLVEKEDYFCQELKSNIDYIKNNLFSLKDEIINSSHKNNILINKIINLIQTMQKLRDIYSKREKNAINDAIVAGIDEDMTTLFSRINAKDEFYAYMISETDIDNYIKKYENIEKHTPELNQDQKKKRFKIKKIVSKEKQTEKEKNNTKKGKKKLLISIIAGGVVVITVIAILTTRNINDNKKKNDDLDNWDPQYETTVETQETHDTTLNPVVLYASDINLDNYEDLMQYAEDIKNSIDNCNLTTADILGALRLANFDCLENNEVFTSREEVCHNTLCLGSLLTQTDSNCVIQKDLESDIYVDTTTLKEILMNMTDNALTIDNFQDAAVNDKFDIYDLCCICVKQMKLNNDTSMDFAKVFNDIVARYLIDFSLCPESPISTRYAIAGMFNASKENNLTLTSGQGLSTIYGSGVKNDGTYGYICVEEEAKFLEISNNNGENLGNEDCYLYSFLIDQNLLTTNEKKLTR